MKRSPTGSRTRSSEVLECLRRFESQNVTFIDPAGDWPIVWERARGLNVWDVEGRKYTDLTAAFGVAAAGHAAPAVVRAAQKQLARLPHAMGDVHPHALKARLARELSRLTFERWSAASGPRRLTAKTVFGNAGFEAVECALKTALLATGRAGVIAFDGAYHGLGHGALNATHRPEFRRPFRDQLVGFGEFIPYPARSADLDRTLQAAERFLRTGRFGALLVEPVQGRGGIRVPPVSFLPALRELADRHQVLLILDEVYTGFGRTGRWFACEHSGVIPDLVCVGKALTGGFPLSACLGRADLMDRAWPASRGEALHTSTFLGNPVGCAMALAQIRELEQRDLPRRAHLRGAQLLAALEAIVADASALPRQRFPCRLAARGLGLMIGLEIRDARGRPATAEALRLVKAMLKSGYILLPEGSHSHVLGFTPPLTITSRHLREATATLRQHLGLD